MVYMKQKNVNGGKVQSQKDLDLNSSSTIDKLFGLG